jgi:ABC-type bacteriocin/lantibiotic exporter with double-glycine peptidase domain
MSSLKKLLFLLNSRERKQVGLLLIMTLIMALLEMFGVASILPFMIVLTNPDILETNNILRIIFDKSIFFGVQNSQQFLFAMGICVFLIFILSIIFKALTTYFQIRFIQMREFSIGKRITEAYLHQPYSWFLDRNSADLGKTILSEVGQVIGGGMRPWIELITRSFTTIALITMLIIINFQLTLIVSIFLGSAYLIVYYFIKKIIKIIGSERLKNNELRFKAISEAFGAIKEIKIGGLEQAYINNFSKPAEKFARAHATNQLTVQLPHFFLEAFAFGGVLLMTLYLVKVSNSFSNAIPIISLYVFAGYRLMPAIQQIYSSFNQLTFMKPAIDKLHSDLISLKPIDQTSVGEIINVNKTINLRKIDYRYPNSSKLTLKNINLSIPAKSIVGIVGSTGSGKTTTVDVILGLLQAENGFLEVDGREINNKNIRSWQRNIGYVPQNIYLSDNTIEENIAFSSNAKGIDYNSVVRSSKIAKLHDFIMDELPKKYQTIVGERGIRLSGGQRQIIGIARALYHNPSILVFDEATSALDNQTEKVIMEAINNLKKKITIILIAHRLNTVKNCDIIYKLDNGKLVATGTFDELFNRN